MKLTLTNGFEHKMKEHLSEDELLTVENLIVTNYLRKGLKNLTIYTQDNRECLILTDANTIHHPKKGRTVTIDVYDFIVREKDR